MIKHFNSNKARQKRHMRARNRVQGTQLRPRLNVFRSGNQIYAQVIDDKTGRTLAAASSLDEVLKDFKPAPPVVATTKVEEQVEVVEVATEAAPVKKAPKAPVKAPVKSQSQKSGGRIAQAKTVLPAAKKGEKKTTIEALAAIAGNHKVALAREVGKLVAQRAKEQGVEQVVFDRGGYAYHGRVAALAEGAREIGLKF